MIDIQVIWQRHGLGPVESIEQPGRGSINAVYIVNDTYVLRVNHKAAPGYDHFKSERRAFERLRGLNMPVPQVIAYSAADNYIILTKLEGTPMIDSWPSLDAAAQQQLAYQAGVYLARIHSATFAQVGNLRTIGQFATWYDFVTDFYRRFADEAVSMGSIDRDAHARGLQFIRDHKPLLDTITVGHLLHSDYHFENILQQDGQITGILDFEWALAGDPAWDMIVDDRWDKYCPGSAAHLMDGYRAHHPAAAGDAERLRVYKLLLYVESITNGKDTDWHDESCANFHATLGG